MTQIQTIIPLGVPPAIQELEEQNPSGDADALENGWDHLEVGRGLANYNSVEIRKLRGCKRYAIAVLG
jgi:glutamate 5-kinase